MNSASGGSGPQLSLDPSIRGKQEG
jgi:hypothetical protein